MEIIANIIPANVLNKLEKVARDAEASKKDSEVWKELVEECNGDIELAETLRVIRSDERDKVKIAKSHNGYQQSLRVNFQISQRRNPR